MSTTVFVTGGSGFIGFEVAKEFRRAGYKVYALVRSEEKSRELLKQEILPVIGNQNKPETYREYVKRAAVVVDTVPDYENSGAATKVLLQTITEESVAGLPKKIYIYTSGMLAYGHSSVVVDETTPLNVHPALKWRTDLELAILAETRVDSLVIRPSMVYGLSGGHSAPFFAHPGEKLVVKGREEKRWSWVHVADLTQAFVLAVRRIAVSKGQIFNICSYSAPTVAELAQKAAALTGFQGPIEYQPKGDDFFSEITDVTLVGNPQKAIDVLGWQPRHLGIIEELELTYEALKAHQGK